MIYPPLLCSTKSTKGARRGYVWGTVGDPISKRSIHTCSRWLSCLVYCTLVSKAMAKQAQAQQLGTILPLSNRSLICFYSSSSSSNNMGYSLHFFGCMLGSIKGMVNGTQLSVWNVRVCHYALWSQECAIAILKVYELAACQFIGQVYVGLHGRYFDLFKIG